jgi:hypothetical protein
MKKEPAICLGGPLDGETFGVFVAVSSRLCIMPHSMVHRYRLLGTVDEPQRDAQGRRVFEHHRAVKAEPKKKGNGIQ